MIFTCAEIDVLALCAWCKDLPVDKTQIFPQDIIDLLCSLKLIRQIRCGLSYRVTPEGYALMQRSGFDFEPDKGYRSQGSVLTRRLQTAEITGFFWRYGADVFCKNPHTEKGTKKFLPSFALRRKTFANVLGGTRLAGFCYTDLYTFIPYYISSENDGIYADVEQRTFRSETLLCKRKPFVLYTGTGTFENILEFLVTQRCKKEKNTTDSYKTAAEKFGCPVAVVPLNENGIRQLRILEIPEYRDKLIRHILGKDYLTPTITQSDGLSKTTKEHYIIGIDCNFLRFESVIKESKTNTHIILLPEQVDAVGKFLKGKSAILHSLDTEIVEQFLGIPHGIKNPPASPFQTEKGDYVYVPLIRQDKTARRKSG